MDDDPAPRGDDAGGPGPRAGRRPRRRPAEAIGALEAAVAVIVAQRLGPKAGRSRLPACISNAGLALLVRDLIEPETFEPLTGPWREVMRD